MHIIRFADGKGTEHWGVRDDAALMRQLTAPGPEAADQTPLRNAIEARDDLTASTALIADQMTARLGPGPVTAKMTAHIIEARPA